MMGSKTTDIESCNCYNFGTFIFPLSNQQIAYIFPYFMQFSGCWDKAGTSVTKGILGKLNLISSSLQLINQFRQIIPIFVPF